MKNARSIAISGLLLMVATATISAQAKPSHARARVAATAAADAWNVIVSLNVANDTPIVITGAFTGGNSGQAGVTVSATQYVYVKQFKNGQPT